MPAHRIDPEVAHRRARLAALTGKCFPAADIEAARLDLAAAMFACQIRRLVAAAPPITPELRAELAALVAGDES